MKKLFIIVVICALNIHFMHPMEDGGSGSYGNGLYKTFENLINQAISTANSISRYTSKKTNPYPYVLDAQNTLLYGSIINAINDKNTDLRLTQFLDGDKVSHDIVYTLSNRVAERVARLKVCIMTEIFGPDPYNQEQKHKPDEGILRAVLKINAQIIPDLDCGCVLRTIREQEKEEQKLINSGNKKQEQEQEELQIPDTGDTRADVILYKFLLMPTKVKSLIIDGILKTVKENSTQATLEQKRALDKLQEGSKQIMLSEKFVAEEYCLNLPDQEFEVLLEKRRKEKQLESESKEKAASNSEKSPKSTNPFVDKQESPYVDNRVSGDK